MITGALALLGVLGVILAIVALSGGSEKLAQATPTPTPPAAVPPAATATPAPTLSPLPTATPGVSPTDTATPDPNASPTTTPEATSTPDESTGNTNSGSSTGATSSKFPDWPGGTGWTVFIESATSLSKAESVATEAQGKGETVGILHSDDYSSLNPGYYVVFTEKYDSQSAAQDARDSIKSDYPDAYVRKVAN
jgi:hypothetical protein